MDGSWFKSLAITNGMVETKMSNQNRRRKIKYIQTEMLADMVLTLMLRKNHGIYAICVYMAERTDPSSDSRNITTTTKHQRHFHHTGHIDDSICVQQSAMLLLGV